MNKMNYEIARADAATALNNLALVALHNRDRGLAADCAWHRANLLAAVGDTEIERELGATTKFLAKFA